MGADHVARESPSRRSPFTHVLQHLPRGPPGYPCDARSQSLHIQKLRSAHYTSDIAP